MIRNVSIPCRRIWLHPIPSINKNLMIKMSIGKWHVWYLLRYDCEKRISKEEFQTLSLLERKIMIQTSWRKTWTDLKWTNNLQNEWTKWMNILPFYRRKMWKSTLLLFLYSLSKKKVKIWISCYCYLMKRTNKLT